jgi:hypothetical protein
MNDNVGSRNERISRLSKRFTTHALGRKSESERNRERKSFYLDADLVGQIDQVYRDINHAIYPKRVSKSTFLETIIERGIADRASLQKLMTEMADSSDMNDIGDIAALSEV